MASFLLFVCLFAFASTEIPNYYWRDYTGTVPQDALAQELGVAIAQITVSSCVNFPGTYYPGKKVAVTQVWGNMESHSQRFRILCTTEPERFTWVHKNIKDVTVSDLANSIIAGYGYADSDVYIGRAYHENEWKIGKMYPPRETYAGLNIWKNNGDGITLEDFELLMWN